MMPVRSVALLVGLVLAGCGGGGGSNAAPAAPVSNGTTAQIGSGVTGTLSLTAANGTGTSATKRNVKFVSAGAVSAGVSINGGTVTFADVSSSSTLCTTTTAGRTCTISVGAPAGSATFAVSLYDAASGGGHLLSSGTGTTTVVAGTAFTVPIALNAVVASLASNNNSNFTVGTPAQSTFTPVWADPASQSITGTAAYLHPITITFSSTHVTASPATLTAPGQQITLSYDGSPAAPSSVTSSISYNGAQIFTGTIPITGLVVTRCNFSPQTQGANQPGQITVGPDNKIWWAEPHTNTIGRIDPAVGCTSMQHFANATGVGAPVGIASGGDGNIWYSTGNVVVGRMTTSGVPTTDGFATITVSAVNGKIGRLANDSQGNVWYVNYGVGFSQVAYVDKTTFAVHTFGSTLTPTGMSASSALALGADNAMWYTEPFTSPHSIIGRISTPANGTAGTYSENGLPGSNGSTIFPFDMAAGPDGNLWVSVFGSNAANQFYASFPPGVPIPLVNVYATQIDPNAFANLVTMFKGGDGSMWIAEGGGAVKIPVATPGAPVVEFFTDDGQTTMINCTAGPDANNWCTAYGSAPQGQGFINTYDGVIYWTPR